MMVKITKSVKLIFSFVFIGVLTGFSQNVGINTTGNPGDQSAGLDVDFEDKGLLIPRVALVETTNQTPITNPETSLFIYNTATVNDVSPGYYYWDGTIWRKLAETGNYWKINGNDNTQQGTDFLGTLNNEGLDFRTNDLLRMRIQDNGQVITGSPTPFMNATFSSFSTGTDEAIGASNDNNGNTVRVHNTGNGRGILSLTYGSGNAVQAQNIGSSGDAFRGFINSPGTGTAFSGTNAGTGRAGSFTATNDISTATTVLVNNVGLGRTVGFQSQNLATDSPVIFSAQSSESTLNNSAAVWSQSNSVASGVFLVTLPNNESKAVNAQYTGGGAVDAIAVYGLSVPEDGYGIGGFFNGSERGVIGQAGPGAQSGVHSVGDLTATGTKPFEIDHPLDPLNKGLRHFAIESDEVLNHYRGNIELNAQGNAVVELPDYFDAINVNFSYTLTAVGAPAPNLHISKEVEGNQFEVSGGEPGMKVSWVVQAERNDMYLQTFPEKRETEFDKKASHVGKYYDPRAYGLTIEDGVFYTSPTIDSLPLEKSPSKGAKGDIIE